jgi:ribonucleoside-diphosphate reductase subunit M1
MKVIKRNGSYEEVSFDKILNRIKALSFGDEFDYKLTIDPTIIAQKVCSEIYDGVKTTELDELSSQISISLYSSNSDYKILASRLVVSNHHKNTNGNFMRKVKMLYEAITNDVSTPLVNKEFYELVNKNEKEIQSVIDYSRDYYFDFFGLKTLEKSYLYKINKIIIERPQDMIMRVSLSIHRDDLGKAFETYDLMSKHYFTHATPTLYNAGSNREQFASCFLLAMKEDSIKGIYNTLSDCASISQHAGGIGLHIHNIRATNSFIAGTNGKSNGIVPMLRVFNDTARYVDQGGGKRNGSFAIYLEPWHADIFEFLELKKNHGNELERARDLFYALWIPDLFMERVKQNKKWSLMCPNKCNLLSDVCGNEFNELYETYENEGKFIKQVDARKLWNSILTSQIETGNPYLLYKDSCNKKSNQQNIGTIKSSNLCTEIIQYSDKDETAVCNLASVSLKKFIVYKDTSKCKLIIYSKPNCIYCMMAKNLCDSLHINYKEVSYKNLLISNEKPIGVTFPKIYETSNGGMNPIGGYEDLEKFIRPSFDYKKLKDVIKIMTHNLNNIIDYNYYPTPETRTSNLRHRPIGLGVQGLANVFFEMRIPFTSNEAKKLNEDIFETIYFSALEASMEIAKNREHNMKQYKNALSQYDTFSNSSMVIDATTMEHLSSTLKPIHEELNKDNYLGSYSSFEGSPLHKGLFQFDLWSQKSSDRYDWLELKNNIKLYGVRNSLLVAPMPTASTAQILGNYECFEPIMSNIYTRRVLAGEFMVLNDYLVNDLKLAELWSTEMKNKIIANDGSIQNIKEIPQCFKERYKIVWEMSQKDIIDMAADRGKYICQSQSLNLFMAAPTVNKLTSMHFYAWSKGLKTGIYYLRTRPSASALQFTVSPNECEACSA